MKVSISWLKEYVPIDMAVADLADALTMAGLEIEAVEDPYAHLDTVVVGRVTTVSAHPNADRLKLCQVDAGDRSVRVVCGAPNVAEGLTVPLAQVGTCLPNGAKLEKTVIRGEASEGMLCSEIELELGLDASGLMVLDEALVPGQPLKQALHLDDTVFEIGLTPNRPDCLSMMGVAREIAAIQGVKMTPPMVALPDAQGDIDALTSVTIDAPDHCPRYAARLIETVAVAPSPYWLQNRLRAVGVRPINNLVDITNFVMLETGQPLHAFDFDHLAGHRIVVRTAANGETFTTLDEKARQLSDQMLMICDGEKPVAVGGVMGGLNSEIEDTTTRVLIESACFDPISIRKTAKTLGLNTDASHRFERGVDPDGTLFALDRAAQLMAELGRGQLVGGTIDADFRTQTPPVIDLSVAATNALLGTEIDRDHMVGMLENIDFTVQVQGENILRVAVPSFRVDVARPQDLMEEVARLSGYNQIPTTFPTLPSEGIIPSPMMVVRNQVKTILCGFGFSEAINYSFISAQSCDRIRLDTDDPLRQHVALLNPISEEQAVMRTSLVPGMLEAAQRNISRQQNNLRLFEIGKAFLPQPDDLLPLEKEMLVGLWSGSAAWANWHTPERACDFYDTKGVVEGLAVALGISGLTYTALPDANCRYTQAGHTAQILSDGVPIGLIGEVDAAVIGNYNLRQAAFIFELDMEKLAGMIPDAIQMTAIPRFPSTARDITVIVDQDVESGRLLETVNRFGESLVENLYLFDVFAGDPIPEGKKSVSFRVVYRSAERTLEDDTVNEIHRHLTQRLITEFGAALPA
ncbi:phenylalanine--tRNA ligase subunit beta [Desulfosarcina ovata]|uniref:Phenylalanine--tRNA ligase beta subunit n=1 Tax=Desulfosarcina ovata subsp. ovata TaxID=2752305 RepID=A0A5K8AJP7_9BACT|nr:phenylalanine--tRNA ligase subunit beta [Desulfosarcina ovata]BBO91894.1 phenylalanine--tRNA ligase beta subunit [Desulfosarcina ovata subsp. ovata]